MLMLAVQSLELTFMGVVFNTVATKIATTMARSPYRTMIHTLMTTTPIPAANHAVYGCAPRGTTMGAKTTAQTAERRFGHAGHWCQVERYFGRNGERKARHALNLLRSVTLSNVEV